MCINTKKDYKEGIQRIQRRNTKKSDITTAVQPGSPHRKCREEAAGKPWSGRKGRTAHTCSHLLWVVSTAEVGRACSAPHPAAPGRLRRRHSRAQQGPAAERERERESLHLSSHTGLMQVLPGQAAQADAFQPPRAGAGPRPPGPPCAQSGDNTCLLLAS